MQHVKCLGMPPFNIETSSRILKFKSEYQKLMGCASTRFQNWNCSCSDFVLFKRECRIILFLILLWFYHSWMLAGIWRLKAMTTKLRNEWRKSFGRWRCIWITIWACWNLVPERRLFQPQVCFNILVFLYFSQSRASWTFPSNGLVSSPNYFR